MRFGVREICNVVLKARKDNQRICGKTYKAGQPVLWFTSLKTSTVEGSSETVYATGGRGNSRLIAWDGDKNLTFNMEDALISPISLAILAGGNLIDSDAGKVITLHAVEDVKADETGKVNLFHSPKANSSVWATYEVEGVETTEELTVSEGTGTIANAKNSVVKVDYYYETNTKAPHVVQIDIAPDSFGGNFYLEAETLFRDEDGIDHPAEFVIPNCKIQSNFTFSMASSGDPSTFSFVLDAFPAPLAHSADGKKVLCSIQICDDDETVLSSESEETTESTIKYL